MVGIIETIEYIQTHAFIVMVVVILTMFHVLIDTMNTFDMAFNDLDRMIVLNRVAYVGSDKQYRDA